ncbi:MAG TPA: H-X9-DG-CTERM domain-containing protein, partial [Verrucomicrobiae bacterium]
AVRINPPPRNPGLGGDFVWTGPGVGNYRAASENWVHAPSQMISFGDGMTFVPPPLSLAIPVTPADPLYNIFPFITQPRGYPGANKNHAGGANMLFCDAHVEFARQTNWLATADENKRLWNADNLSHPSFQ